MYEEYNVVTKQDSKNVDLCSNYKSKGAFLLRI